MGRPVSVLAKIAVAQHFFSDVEDDGAALERYAAWDDAETYDDIPGEDEIWEAFADWDLPSVWNAMEEMHGNLMRLFGDLE